jgi:hypothetical protein
MKHEEPLYCPKCGKDSGAQPDKNGQWISGGLIFLLGGLFPFLGYFQTQKELVRCIHCQFVFLPSPSTRKSELSSGVLWLMIGVAAIVIFLIACLKK